MSWINKTDKTEIDQRTLLILVAEHKPREVHVTETRHYIPKKEMVDDRGNYIVMVEAVITLGEEKYLTTIFERKDKTLKPQETSWWKATGYSEFQKELEGLGYHNYNPNHPELCYPSENIPVLLVDREYILS